MERFGQVASVSGDAVEVDVLYSRKRNDIRRKKFSGGLGLQVGWFLTVIDGGKKLVHMSSTKGIEILKQVFQDDMISVPRKIKLR